MDNHIEDNIIRSSIDKKNKKINIITKNKKQKEKELNIEMSKSKSSISFLFKKPIATTEEKKSKPLNCLIQPSFSFHTPKKNINGVKLASSPSSYLNNKFPLSNNLPTFCNYNREIKLNKSSSESKNKVNRIISPESSKKKVIEKYSPSSPESINKNLLNFKQSVSTFSPISIDKNRLTKSCVKKLSKEPIKLKPILKSSKIKIEEMKSKISKLFSDKTIMTNNITELQNKNEQELADTFNSAQKILEDKIDELYKSKLSKLDFINCQYDEEIFKLKEYKGKIGEIKNSKEKLVIDVICQMLINDKEKELKKCEEEFKLKKEEIMGNYRETTDELSEFTLDERVLIYKNELYENFKDKIHEAVKKKKKVSIQPEQIVEPLVPCGNLLE